MTSRRRGPNAKFIKVFRGLQAHLPHIDSSAFKLYLNLLFHAMEHEGTLGRVTTTNVRLKEETGLSTDTIAKALKTLSENEVVDEHGQIFGPYISIEDHGKSKTITVLRWENPFAGQFRGKSKSRRAGSPSLVHEGDEEFEALLRDSPF
jgi:hypothetical protein